MSLQVSVRTLRKASAAEKLSPFLDSLRIVLVPRESCQVCIEGQAYCGSSYGAYLVRPGERIDFAQKSSAYFLLEATIQIPDPLFCCQVMSLPARLPVSQMLVRNCLMNIMMAMGMNQSHQSFILEYYILSLLFHSLRVLFRTHPTPSLFTLEGESCPAAKKSLLRILDYIEDNLSGEIDKVSVGKSLKLSSQQIDALFRREYDCSFFQFVCRFRILRAKELLCYTSQTITEIAHATGFNSVHYFSRYFKEKEGISPLLFRNAHSQTHWDRQARMTNVSQDATIS